jgi:hypothetical protein
LLIIIRGSPTSVVVWNWRHVQKFKKEFFRHQSIQRY